MMALRKICETDNAKWDLYLPFIEYCYNTRKHSVTGFSTFELLYGVKPNRFMDYNEDNSQEDEEALAERTIQLKKLVDSTRAAASINLEKNKVIQTKIQDNRADGKIVEELAIVTKVMVKVEGLRAKLEPRFHGKFEIAEITRSGNYKLKNASGEVMKQSWPITKLRPIKGL